MEKKIYFAPEVKFHQLKAKVAMLAGSGDDDNEKPFNPEDGKDQDAEAKGFGSFYFDED